MDTPKALISEAQRTVRLVLSTLLGEGPTRPDFAGLWESFFGTVSRIDEWIRSSGRRGSDGPISEDIEAEVRQLEELRTQLIRLIAEKKELLTAWERQLSERIGGSDDTTTTNGRQRPEETIR